MRILIDECLDWRLCRELSGHDCVSVQKMGWAGVANGELLTKAETGFDVFITGDRNLAFQQYVDRFTIIIIVLHPRSTKLLDTQPLIAKVVERLSSADSGQVIDIYP